MVETKAFLLDANLEAARLSMNYEKEKDTPHIFRYFCGFKSKLSSSQDSRVKTEKSKLFCIIRERE